MSDAPDRQDVVPLEEFERLNGAIVPRDGSMPDVGEITAVAQDVYRTVRAALSRVEVSVDRQDVVTLRRWVGGGLPPGPWATSLPPVAFDKSKQEVAEFVPLAALEVAEKRAGELQEALDELDAYYPGPR